MSRRGEAPRLLSLLVLTPLLLTRTQPTRAAPMTLATAFSVAQAQAPRQNSPQEQKRRKLLEGIGLRKQDQSPPAPPPSPSTSTPPSSSPPDTAPVAGDPGATPKAARPVGLPGAPSFRQAIHPLLVNTCKVCHGAGGAAAATTFVLSGDAVADHGVVLRAVDLRAPAASALLAKASGDKPHAGGIGWPSSGAAYGRVLAWAQRGARLDGAGAPATPAMPGVAGTTAAAPAAERSPVAAKAPQLPAPAPQAEAAASSGTIPAPAPAAAIATPVSVPGAVDFVTQVHPLLIRACATCHSPTGVGATTRLRLSGAANTDYPNIRALVDLKFPARSLLITKGAGEAHAGGAAVVPGAVDHTLLVKWVAAGAVEQQESSAGSPSASGELTEVPKIADAAVGSSEPPPRATGGAPAAIAAPRHPGTTAIGREPGLPYGLALNGRFDLAYERSRFSGNPFDGAAVDALRSYHRFLFLSRQSADDPVGLSVEVLSLQFWEAHARWRAKTLPIQVVVAAGKIIVPFGAEPLMHQSYGGLAGFDQRILPVIWAQHGLAVRAVAHRRDLTITDDLFVVRGYGLRQVDAIINLQNDFSSEDDVRLGWGNRLGVAWGPLSGWYSTYYNRLGFGRRLLMQAADVMLWRMRGVPVLGHFSFAAGMMRADISGGDGAGTGGPGRDYYHFGSYFQGRYHPTDWLYFQYRQGLRTFNNRRGMIVDDTRLTGADGSTHNFGVVGRLHGLTAGLYYFINLEKADEVADDFLRASLTYDF